EQKEEKKNEGINEKNVWKQKMKRRKDFFCKNYPTLVIGPVKGHQLKSQISILKIFGKKGKTLAELIKANIFLMTWKTVFIHFQTSTTQQQLENLVHNFNEMQQENEQKENEENIKKQKLQNAPSTTLDIIKIRNQKNLEVLELNVEKVERLKGLPMVKVTFSNTNDAKRDIKIFVLDLMWRNANTSINFEVDQNHISTNARIVSD
ncbi:hypothetical protein RFI_36939, partial [Reticulomyxa filosa]